MPGLQSIVKAWTKINYDHVEYVADEKRSGSAIDSTTADDASILQPRRPSTSTSSSGGEDGKKLRQRKNYDQSVRHRPPAAFNDGSAAAVATAVGGMAMLLGDDQINGDERVAKSVDKSIKNSIRDGYGSSSSVAIDRSSPTRSQHAKSPHDAAFAMQQQQQQHELHHYAQHFQHRVITNISTEQKQNLHKSPPPTLPTPSSLLTSNLSHHTFSLNNGGEKSTTTLPTQPRKIDYFHDRNQFHPRHITNHQYQSNSNDKDISDVSYGEKSAPSVTTGGKREYDSSAVDATNIDVALNTLQLQQRQLHQAINSARANHTRDDIPDSRTPLASNNTRLLRPTSHDGETSYSPSQKQKASYSPRSAIRDMRLENDANTYDLLSRQTVHQEEHLDRQMSPRNQSSRTQYKYTIDEGRYRRGRSSSLLELFLLEEEQQKLDSIAPNLALQDGGEDDDEYEEGEARNMMSYHRRQYVMGGPLRGQQKIPKKSNTYLTRNKSVSDDRWMRDWLNHSDQTTTPSLANDSSDQRLRRNSHSTESTGTTVTANRSTSITSNANMKFSGHPTINESFDMIISHEPRNPHSRETSTHSIPLGKLNPAPPNHCNRCEQMESALLALHADLEYLRSMEIQHECVEVGTLSSDFNGQTSSIHLPPIDQKKTLNQDAINIIPTLQHTSSQSISSAVTMGSRGSFASSRFGSITRPRQHQQQQQQRRQQHHTQQHHKSDSSHIELNTHMIIRGASKRLSDLSIRHKRQMKQSMQDGAYWQNDMHLKLEKFALMCKNLNEEAACRGNEVTETKALLDKMTSERNLLASEIEVLRAKVNLYEQESAEKNLIQKEWEQERINLMNDRKREIKVRDDAIDEMSRRLELAVEAIESERKLQSMRRSIIFPHPWAQPSSPPLVQHKHLDEEKDTNFTQATPMDSPSKITDFYLDQLKKSKDISAKAKTALTESMIQSASREKELHIQIAMLKTDLARAQASNSLTNSRNEDALKEMNTDGNTYCGSSIYYQRRAPLPCLRRQKSL